MTSLLSNSSRRPPILETAGFGCDMPFAITGPANNTKSTTKFISPRRARGSAASGGGSSAQMKTDGCASSICRLARADFDHDAPIGLLMLRSAKPSTTGPCGGHKSSAVRLGDDQMDGHYPEKPPRMRGATYDRLLTKLIADSRMRRSEVTPSRVEYSTRTIAFRMDASRRSAKMSAWDRSYMRGVRGAARGWSLSHRRARHREGSGARVATSLIP
jgi:hypothetical protein